MFDFLSSLFAARQINALTDSFVVLGDIVKNMVNFNFKSVAALFTVMLQLFSAFILDTPVTPYKDSIDMDKFELTFEDDFEIFYRGTVAAIAENGTSASVSLDANEAIKVEGTSYSSTATWEGNEWVGVKAAQ